MRSVMILIVTVLALSCARTVYRPVDSVSRDSVYRVSDREMLFYVLDSVSVDLTGDTVRENRTRVILRDIASRDTLYIERGDTIVMVREQNNGMTRYFPRYLLPVTCLLLLPLIIFLWRNRQIGRASCRERV